MPKIETVESDDYVAATETRLMRQRELRKLLGDRVTEDKEGLAHDLISFALTLFAEANPVSLPATDIEKIKGNNPAATEALITERAMSAKGLADAIAALSFIANVGIAYSPQSNVQAALEKDEGLEDVVRGLYARLGQPFQEAVDKGFSAFGATTIMVVSAIQLGQGAGVPWQALLRPLFESVEYILAQRPDA